MGEFTIECEVVLKRLQNHDIAFGDEWSRASNIRLNAFGYLWLQGFIERIEDEGVWRINNNGLQMLTQNVHEQIDALREENKRKIIQMEQEIKAKIRQMQGDDNGDN